MREIKFRGKREDNGEWVHGNFVLYEHMGEVKHIIVTDWAQVYVNSHFVIPETVGQYTGLKDKNGVEIYEGDVVKGYSVYPTASTFESFLMGEVYYTNRGTWECYSYILGGFNEQVEVIGNIYENPEMLKEREDESEETEGMLDIWNYKNEMTTSIEAAIETETTGCHYCRGIESHGIVAVKTVIDEYLRVIQAYDTPYNYCPNCGRKIKED